ncbi:MAG TPA: ATP-binding protein [Candidatus Nitrosopolaris sp.]|nr:ATP-binding protein [Candidatus Nitrosopolaris sp.]
MGGNSGRITVRERIDPEITATLFANYRSSADALMELIDNALDSRLPGQPMKVEVAVHGDAVTVMSEGGEGMGPKDLERRYLRWGKSAKRGKELIGQYGQGGKAAIGHLGHSFSVESSRPGDAIGWRFTDPNYRDRSRLKTYELQEVSKRVAEDLGYVRIRVDEVDKRVDLKRVGQRLADAFRLLLERGDLQIILNGSPLKPRSLGEIARKDFRVRAAATIVGGWVGTVDPVKRTADFVPGVRCYRLGRLVKDGEFFGHPTPAQEPGMALLIGEVEIPRVPLTINKSDFDRDSAPWVDIEGRLHRLLKPIARQLSRQTESPPPQSAIKVAQQVRRLLSQALRWADRPELFLGTAPVRPRISPPTNGDRASQPHLAEEGHPPVSHPVSNAPAKRRGFGDIVIRPLGPAIRSQTVIEDAVKVVVINSQHPLFRERKGDIWYQLETAASEICKSIEGVTVAEYERRVNEIVLLALRLRGRRRQVRTLPAQLKVLQQGTDKTSA